MKHLLIIYLICLYACNYEEPPKYDPNYIADYNTSKVAALSIWSQQMGLLNSDTYYIFERIEIIETDDIKSVCKMNLERLYGCFSHPEIVVDINPDDFIIYIKTDEPEYKKANAAGHECLHLFLFLETGDADADHELDHIWKNDNQNNSLESMINELILKLES